MSKQNRPMSAAMTRGTPEFKALERERRAHPVASVIPGYREALEQQAETWRTLERARHRHNTRMAWAIFGSLSLAGMALIGGLSPDPGWQAFGYVCWALLAACWLIAISVDSRQHRAKAGQ